MKKRKLELYITGKLMSALMVGKRDPYKPIDYLGVFSIGEFVGYLVRCLVAPAFVWFPDILIGLPDNLIQVIAAVWLVVMSIFVPILVERTIDGF